MSRRCGVSAAVAILASAASATSALTASAAIIIGKGVGPVRLWQTKAQVQHELGRPYRIGDLGGGFRNWEYIHGPLSGGAVLLDRQGLVYGVGTGGPKQKTSKHIGVGSTLKKLRRAYPKVKCHFAPKAAYNSACTITEMGKGDTIITVFSLDYNETKISGVTISDNTVASMR